MFPAPALLRTPPRRAGRSDPVALVIVMSRPHAAFPAPHECLYLHLRLGEGDPLAPADACCAFLGPLLAWVAEKYPNVDIHLRQDAVHQALMTYVQGPAKYEPSLCELAVYLRMATRGDLLNLLDKEKRHHRHRVAWKIVEEDAHGRYLSGTEPEPFQDLEVREQAEQAQTLLRSLKATLTPGECEVLDLMLQGERRTAVFAAALGIGDLPVAEQERAVKREKDRLKKRLERGGRTHD